jgi:hypothetical protein
MLGIRTGLALTGLAAFVAVFTVAAQPLRAGEVKTFTQEITGPQAEYTIEVGGALDPENVEIKFENLGDTPVKDPRMTVNGIYDWYDINTMAKEITRGCTTDEEKALAIWEWILWKRYQLSPSDDSAVNPVRAVNGYGYGICGHSAAWLKALCLASGVQARVQEIWGHTVNEAFWDGKWHFLDSNVKVYYLGRDNKTLASLAELEKDPWLIERTIHPRDPWVRQEDPKDRNEEFVRYIVSYKDNYVEESYDSEIAKKYNMSYTLKPGETLLRWWTPRLAKFEGRDKRPVVPQRYANGQSIWEPDLKKVDMKDYIKVIDNVTTRQQDGIEPAIHVAYPQDDLDSRPARFSIPIQSAYPVVGGRVWTRLFKQTGYNAVSMFFGNPEWEGSGLYTFRWGSGAEDIEVDLDQSLLKVAPVYDYEIGYTLMANGRRKPATQAGVDYFKSVSDLQVSPHALPALKLGKNTVRFWSAGQGPQKIRITHTWREATDNHAPGKVAKATSPAEFKTLAPTLKWQAASDPDAGDSVADYQVMVSLRPDCRWPLSNSVYRNVGSPAAEWTVPASFLNPGTTYYFKVRSRDSKGAISEWSDVFSFKTAAGAK